MLCHVMLCYVVLFCFVLCYVKFSAKQHDISEDQTAILNTCGTHDNCTQDYTRKTRQEGTDKDVGARRASESEEWIPEVFGVECRAFVKTIVGLFYTVSGAKTACLANPRRLNLSIELLVRGINLLLRLLSFVNFSTNRILLAVTHLDALYRPQKHSQDIDTNAYNSRTALVPSNKGPRSSEHICTVSRFKI
jgi:hypothetical protein